MQQPVREQLEEHEQQAAPQLRAASRVLQPTAAFTPGLAWLLPNVLVALACWGSGKLGLLLAIAPDYTSAIAPQAGVAVAAALLLGPRALFGISVGTFALQLGVMLTPLHPSPTIQTVLAAISVMLAAVLQAWLAARLVHRRIGFPHTLESGSAVAQFLLLTGPLPCAIGGACAALAQLWLGAFPAADYLSHAGIAWLGQTLGVIVVAPMVLTFLAEPRAVWRRRRVSVALPMALLATVAGLTFVRTSALEQHREQHEFDVLARGFEHALTARIDSCLQVLESLRDLYSASKLVERVEFRHFVAGALRRSPGLLALEWVPRVPDTERAAFEANAQADWPGYRIRALHDAPASRMQADAFPVFYAEPDAVARGVMGIDVSSEANRRRALERARELGTPQGSERLQLVVGPRDVAGVMVALAVYDTEQPNVSVMSRRAALLGYVLAVFRVDALVRSALGDAAERSLTAHIDDVARRQPPRELYGEPEELAERPRLALQASIDMAGRRWLLRLRATDAYVRAHATSGAWSLLTRALFVCGILGAFLLVLTGRTVVLERTSKDTEQLLSTLVQSSHDAIIAYDHTGVIVGWNAGAARSFGWDASEAVGRRADLFVPAESLAEQRANMRRAINGESQAIFEAERTVKSGERREFEIKLSPILAAAGSVRGASEICRDITQHKTRDRQLRASLHEKEVLLKEVHHRVKNNLQVISSLLSLQASYLPTPEERALFGESQARVQSIALVHDQLYRSTDLSHVDFEAYARTLVAGVFQTQCKLGQRIEYSIVAEHIQLDIDTSVPCGLILNELVTNALKHAFPKDRGGQLTVSLVRLPSDLLELCVSDDGIGLPASLDPRESPSLGLELVFTLADQLDATVSVERAHGTMFRFCFRQVGSAAIVS